MPKLWRTRCKTHKKKKLVPQNSRFSSESYSPACKCPEIAETFSKIREGLVPVYLVGLRQLKGPPSVKIRCQSFWFHESVSKWEEIYGKQHCKETKFKELLKTAKGLSEEADGEQEFKTKTEVGRRKMTRQFDRHPDETQQFPEDKFHVNVFSTSPAPGDEDFHMKKVPWLTWFMKLKDSSLIELALLCPGPPRARQPKEGLNNQQVNTDSLSDHTRKQKIGSIEAEYNKFLKKISDTIKEIDKRLKKGHMECSGMNTVIPWI